MYEQNRSFESNKMLGGIGALLTAIGSFVPFTGPIGIVSIVGVILLLISLKGLADDFREPAIWRNTLTGFIFVVIAIIAAIVVAAIAAASIYSFGLSPFVIPLGVLGIIAAIIGLIIVFVFYLLAAVNFRRAFDILGQKTGERLFHTGGFLLFIGAILVIIFVGFILLFVAWILLAVALFSMRSPASMVPPTREYPQPTSPIPPSPSEATAQVKYCPYCGAQNKIDAAFCTRCGKQLAKS